MLNREQWDNEGEVGMVPPAFRIPIPSAIEEAFALDQVVVTPRGTYHQPLLWTDDLVTGWSASLATWSRQVLNAVSAAYDGRIDDVFINKAETGLKSVKTAPATVHADGQIFEIHVDATNLSSQAIITGVEVIVTKPDGSKVSPAIDWGLFGQGVNVKIRWAYNIAAVNLAGNWSAVITYYAK